MKKIILIVIAVIVVICVGLVIAFNLIFGEVLKMNVLEYDKELTIFIGGGGNSIVLKSENNDQILIVDTKMMDPAKKMKEYIEDSWDYPEITIVNTHNHMDHVDGNKYYPAGRVITGDYDEEERRKSTEKKGLQDIRLKPYEEYRITIDREVVIIKNMGQAHTLNDLIVYLVKRKILLTGDIVFSERHPVIIESEGTDADKWMKVLNNLLEDYPGSTVIPGHGDISDESAIVALMEYFDDIKSAVGDKKIISDLRKKYDHFDGVPFMSGFDKTLRHFQKKMD